MRFSWRFPRVSRCNLSHCWQTCSLNILRSCSVLCFLPRLIYGLRVTKRLFYFVGCVKQCHVVWRMIPPCFTACIVVISYRIALSYSFDYTSYLAPFSAILERRLIVMYKWFCRLDEWFVRLITDNLSWMNFAIFSFDVAYLSTCVCSSFMNCLSWVEQWYNIMEVVKGLLYETMRIIVTFQSRILLFNLKASVRRLTLT